MAAARDRFRGERRAAVDAERKSVNRAGVLAKINAAAAERQDRSRPAGAGEPGIVPAE